VKYVWNRSPAALERVPPALRLASLAEVAGAGADIVVEVRLHRVPCVRGDGGGVCVRY
jgi:hypothetical protein